MNKIGFALTRTWKGYDRIGQSYNDGEWSNKVVDIRQYITHFDGLGVGSIISLLSFDEKGCYLTLLSPIEGRGLDNLCAWIYIPKEIEISGKEVVKIHNFIKECILSGKNSMEKFEQKYPVKDCPFSYKATTGTKFGYRDISKDSLEEILDTDRYQDYYSKYKAIFLLDPNSGVSISEKDKYQFEDLTGNEIVKTCIVKAPIEDDLNHLGNDAKVYIQYGEKKEEEFKENIRIKQGETFGLIAKRYGLDPIEKSYTVNKKETQVTIIEIFGQVDWTKTVTTSMFHIKTGNEEEITKAKILINNKELKKELIIKEDKLSKAQVSVSADGYEECTEIYDLKQEKIDIPLTQVRKGEICIKNEKTAEITLKSQYLPVDRNESPISGYHYEDKGRKLVPDNKTKRTYKPYKYMTQGFLTCAVIVAIAVAYVYLSTCLTDRKLYAGNLVIQKKTENVQTDVDNAVHTEEASTEDSDSTEAINKAFNYLEKNKKWSKAGMDSIPLLKGLFDEMNEFKLADIIAHRKDLNGSNKFKEVYDAVFHVANKHIAIPGKNNGCYNAPNDSIITIRNYTDYLNKLTQPQ